MFMKAFRHHVFFKCELKRAECKERWQCYRFWPFNQILKFHLFLLLLISAAPLMVRAQLPISCNKQCTFYPLVNIHTIWSSNVLFFMSIYYFVFWCENVNFLCFAVSPANMKNIYITVAIPALGWSRQSRVSVVRVVQTGVITFLDRCHRCRSSMP